MASIIKADNIQKVSDGTNIIKKCGSTTTIGSGACSPIVICGSTVTLGRTGGTVQLACGASQSGFGQTYSASLYCTTAKTSPFTASAGTGYFVNTTCGAVTVTLPATPTAGDVISFKDYGSTWQTNAVLVCNNGSKINGVCASTSFTTQDQSVTLIYVDGTKGWQDINDSTAAISGGSLITATGGTITTCGDYKIHTFTSDGNFVVSGGGGPLAKVDYLVLAGGGSGGSGPNGGYSGGGGAGGYRESKCACVSGCWTASPLASSTSVPVTIGTYVITVGAGGTAGPSTPGSKGTDSSFSTITSAGGGNGTEEGGPSSGYPGGSGGGSYYNSSGGTGNSPPVSPPQGNPGGTSPQAGPSYASSGGGGAGGAGTGGVTGQSGPGGSSVASSITGSSVDRAGGGGGGGSVDGATRGVGGGGGAGNGGSGPGGASSATANTGSGGAGGYGYPGWGGNGGSGIVILRYKFQ